MAKRRLDDRGVERARPADAARAAATERAMLELSGERGYEAVTVAALLERGGVNRTWFYATYAGKPDCYARAYAGAAEAFCVRLLTACAEAADPAAGLPAALAELGRFLTADPALAAGVLAEARVVGGAALAKRNEVFERLAAAISPAGGDGVGSGHPPPRLAAAFILDAIEAAAIKALREDGDVESLVGELAELALAYYPDGAVHPDEAGGARRG